MSHLDLNASEDDTLYYTDKIWVQCEYPHCTKWRLVPKDDSSLDQDWPWYCHMNPDPLFSHCSVPQGPFPKDSLLREHGLKMVYSELPVGSLVLVKASTWPWWPAILSPDPFSEEYVGRDNEGYVDKYHVEFLGNPHSRFWATAKKVELFKPPSITPKNLKAALKKSYDTAIEEALRMQDLGCQERLQMCHFKPMELLCQAQSLMNAIEKMIRQCNTESPSTLRICTAKGKLGCTNGTKRKLTPVLRECGDCSIVETEDTMIIDGFRNEMLK